MVLLEPIICFQVLLRLFKDERDLAKKILKLIYIIMYHLVYAQNLTHNMTKTQNKIPPSENK
jgi:hypothetical protein